MNSIHLHLMLNHIPIFGTIILFILFSYSVFRQKEDLSKKLLWLFPVLAVFTTILILTGDPSANVVRTYEGINREAIDTHETFGYISFYLILAISALSFAGIYFSKKKNILPSWIKYGIIILSFLCTVAIAWTGKLGGEIRHVEISKGINPEGVHYIEKDED